MPDWVKLERGEHEKALREAYERGRAEERADAVGRMRARPETEASDIENGEHVGWADAEYGSNRPPASSLPSRTWHEFGQLLDDLEEMHRTDEGRAARIERMAQFVWGPGDYEVGSCCDIVCDAEYRVMVMGGSTLVSASSLLLLSRALRRRVSEFMGLSRPDVE